MNEETNIKLKKNINSIRYRLYAPSNIENVYNPNIAIICYGRNLFWKMWIIAIYNPFKNTSAMLQYERKVDYKEHINIVSTEIQNQCPEAKLLYSGKLLKDYPELLENRHHG